MRARLTTRGEWIDGRLTAGLWSVQRSQSSARPYAAVLYILSAEPGQEEIVTASIDQSAQTRRDRDTKMVDPLSHWCMCAWIYAGFNIGRSRRLYVGVALAEGLQRSSGDCRAGHCEMRGPADASYRAVMAIRP